MSANRINACDLELQFEFNSYFDTISLIHVAITKKHVEKARWMSETNATVNSGQTYKHIYNL